MHNTGNPIGSDSILDLYDNSSCIDNYVNSQEDFFPDRFGTKRLTLAGLIKRSMALRNEINDFSGALTFKPEWSDVPMNVSEGVGGEGGALNLQAEALGNRSEINKLTSREALRRTYQEVGLNLVDGSFEQGGNLNTVTDILLEEKTGKCYSWTGSFPKEVSPNTDPTLEESYTARTKSILRKNTLERWKPTGIIIPLKANTIEPETLFKYDEIGAQYLYNPDTVFILEDFGYGPDADGVWNSRVFNALIPKAKGMFITSRSVDVTVHHDAPIDIINRVTITLPQSLRIRKTGNTLGSKIRTITPAGGNKQNYTFNKDCVFNIIPETDTINYAIYVNIIGGDLGGDGESNKGIFDAPMAAYCTLSRIIGSESAFFWSGLDNFQNTFEDIRSRFSSKHFTIDNGTSNHFSRVACDGGKAGTSSGVGFQLGCSYTTMTVCAADKIQLSYDFYKNAEVVMLGCGSESFGRLIRARDNSVVVVKGGKLQYDVVLSNIGIRAEPWSSYDKATLMFEGTTLVAKNYTTSTDDVAFLPLERPIATGYSRLIAKECKHPSASSIVPVFQGDEINVLLNAYAEWGCGQQHKRFTTTSRYVTQFGDKQCYQKEVPNVPGDGTWVTIGQFDLSNYGNSVMGEITLSIYSPYSVGVGFLGFGKALFAAAQNSSGGLVTTSITSPSFANVDFSPSNPSPTIALQFIVSNQLAIMQIKLTSAGGNLGPSLVSVELEYVARKAGNFGRVDFV